jgi:hypothetical protein
MANDAAVLVAGRYARGTALAAVLITGFWHVGNNVTAIVVGWSAYRWPALTVAAWLAYAVIAAVAAAPLLSYRPQLESTVPLRASEPRAIWPLAVAAIGLTVASALACRPEQDFITPPNWGWGAAGWLGVLLFWHRRLRTLVGFLGLNTAASLAMMLLAGQDDRIDLSRFMMVIVGSSALQLGFAGGTRALNAAADWAAQASAKHAAAVLRQTVANEIHEARQLRYEALQRTAARLLGALADGTADPGDAEVQRRCAAEAARLRRLFVEIDDLPHPLVHELRACADVAERKGVVVDLVAIGAVPVLSREVRRGLAEATIEALAATRSRARLTVLGTGERVVVSLVADCDAIEVAPRPAPDVAARVWTDNGRVWIEASWPG